jgi:ABC-type transporter Mla MlaB component
MTDLLWNAREEAMLIMEGDLTIERAAELKGMLLDALKSSASVIIHFKENSKTDVSFLQLVCAAHRSALSFGKHLKLSRTIPETLLQEIRSVGYAHHPVWDFNNNTAIVKSQGGNNE